MQPGRALLSTLLNSLSLDEQSGVLHFVSNTVTARTPQCNADKPTSAAVAGGGGGDTSPAWHPKLARETVVLLSDTAAQRLWPATATCPSIAQQRFRFNVALARAWTWVQTAAAALTSASDGASAQHSTRSGHKWAALVTSLPHQNTSEPNDARASTASDHVPTSSTWLLLDADECASFVLYALGAVPSVVQHTLPAMQSAAVVAPTSMEAARVVSFVQQLQSLRSRAGTGHLRRATDAATAHLCSRLLGRCRLPLHHVLTTTFEPEQAASSETEAPVLVAAAVTALSVRTDVSVHRLIARLVAPGKRTAAANTLLPAARPPSTADRPLHELASFARTTTSNSNSSNSSGGGGGSGSCSPALKPSTSPPSSSQPPSSGSSCGTAGLKAFTRAFAPLLFADEASVTGTEGRALLQLPLDAQVLRPSVPGAHGRASLQAQNTRPRPLPFRFDDDLNLHDQGSTRSGSHGSCGSSNEAECINRLLEWMVAPTLPVEKGTGEAVLLQAMREARADVQSRGLVGFLNGDVQGLGREPDVVADDLRHTPWLVLLNPDASQLAYLSLVCMASTQPLAVCASLGELSAVLSGLLHFTAAEMVKRRYHSLFAHAAGVVATVVQHSTEQQWKQIGAGIDAALDPFVDVVLYHSGTDEPQMQRCVLLLVQHLVRIGAQFASAARYLRNFSASLLPVCPHLMGRAMWEATVG